MRSIFSAGLTGLLFGLGLVVSGMINPAKVLNFLDLAGSWDPSLAFVMGGALIVTFIGYRLVLGRDQPFFEGKFQLPSRTSLDTRLIGGSALFGIGWGLAGLCPGPAITAAGLGLAPVFIFLASMLGTIAVWRWIEPMLAGRSRPA